MPEYLAPGVFVEEIDSGSKPIEGVGINTGAFIGYAKSGPFNKPTFIANWTQFCEEFGQEEHKLTRALCSELKLTVEQVRAAKQASRKSWRVFAEKAIEKAIKEKAVKLKSFQEFLRTYQIPAAPLPYMEDSYLAHAVRGYYDNGGSRCYIVRVARPQDLEELSFQANGAAHDSGAKEAVPAQIMAGPLAITAKQAGKAGNDIKVEVEPVGDAGEFRLKVSKGDETERHPEKEKDPPLTLETAAKAVNSKSRLITLEVTETATRLLDKATHLLDGGLDATTANVPAKQSGNGALALPRDVGSLVPNDFIGDEAQRTGFNGLSAVDNVNFIAIPDLMAGAFKREEVYGDSNETIPEEVLVLDGNRAQGILDAQCALVAYCERSGIRQAILDPIPGLKPQEMNDITMRTPYNSDHGQGCIYYPWIKTIDPDPNHKTKDGRSPQMLCPPSGHIAGVWARVGVTRGVHKAPANEVIFGAVDLEYQVTKSEQELLNPNGINCIRSFPGRGIRIWGARTLATVSNQSWKYINVRRLFNYLKETLDRSMQWVVFEPNDHDLWGRVRRNIAAFLWVEWKEGKLFGATPAEAFFVKCDEETNPQEMIDLGRLYCEIGVNPVKPAEFVILQMGQWSGGGAMMEQ